MLLRHSLLTCFPLHTLLCGSFLSFVHSYHPLNLELCFILFSSRSSRCLTKSLRQSRENFFSLRHSVLAVAGIFCTFLFVSSSSESLLLRSGESSPTACSFSPSLFVSLLALVCDFFFLRVLPTTRELPSRCEPNSFSVPVFPLHLDSTLFSNFNLPPKSNNTTSASIHLLPLSHR